MWGTRSEGQVSISLVAQESQSRAKWDGTLESTQEKRELEWPATEQRDTGADHGPAWVDGLGQGLLVLEQPV